MFILQHLAETVVLLSDKKVDGYIDIDLDVEKLEGKSENVTYAEIKTYIKEKHGLNVCPCIQVVQIWPQRSRRTFHPADHAGFRC